MDEWIEVSAKTTEEAVTEALIQLGTTSDNVEYEVLEKESRGFFGIGSRSAKIRARVKKEEKPAAEQVPAKEEKKPVKEAEKKDSSEKTEKKQPSNSRQNQNKENRPYRRENKSFREKGENGNVPA